MRPRGNDRLLEVLLFRDKTSDFLRGVDLSVDRTRVISNRLTYVVSNPLQSETLYDWFRHPAPWWLDLGSLDLLGYLEE